MTMQGERILVVDIGVRGLYFAAIFKKELGELHAVEAAAAQGGVKKERLPIEFQNELRSEFNDVFNAVPWNPLNTLLEELGNFTRIVVVGFECMPMVQRLLPAERRQTVGPISERDIPNPYHLKANEWHHNASELVKEWIAKHVACPAVA